MSGVKAAPAPWKLKGSTWIFVLSALGQGADFPSGFAASGETEALLRGGKFIGGLGLVQLVSYTESPVGPCDASAFMPHVDDSPFTDDELIYIPGRWSYEHAHPAFRITRIYVSSKESTENGRRNWNIPKHVAKFEYKPGPDGTTTFSVTLPDATEPFFKASIKPVPIVSRLSIPSTSKLLGQYFSLMQPPLPRGEKSEEVGTDKWAALTPVMSGTARVMKMVPGFEDGSVGNGVDFPKVKPWSTATMMQDADLDFGVSTWSDTV